MHAARQWQDITSQYGQHRLLSTMESAFEPHNDNDQVYYIEQLELDLQQVTSEEELDLQIRKLLREKIPGLVQENRKNLVTQRPDTLTRPYSLIRGLENYFLRGY